MSVRGYAEWKPKPEARHWVLRTLDVLDQYQDYWPLSVRQLFYRLVAEHAYPKSEADYGRLTGILSRARRAGLIPWDAIRDGGLGRTVPPRYFEDAADFHAAVRRTAERMHLNRQEGQSAVIELWCEAGGMVPILEGIADPYSCRVNTGGGYDSVTAKHNLAVRVRERAEEGLRTIVLHVGDFDGSGEDMAHVLEADTSLMVISQVLKGVDPPEEVAESLEFIKAGDADEGDYRSVGDWARGYFTVERVALTGEQVVERNVETAPPKRSDSRTAEFVQRNAAVVEALGTENISAQLEALTPPELNELISEAIEAHFDLDVYRSLMEREEDVREELLRRLDG